MEDFRNKIDNIDDKIMELLVNRYLIVKDIGKFKKDNNLPVYDEKRENYIYDKIDDCFLLDDHRNFLKSIYKNIMFETKKIQ